MSIAKDKKASSVKRKHYEESFHVDLSAACEHVVDLGEMIMIEKFYMEALKVAFGAALGWSGNRIRKSFRKQFYFKVFGGSGAEEEEPSIIYAEFELNPHLHYPVGLQQPYAYVKPAHPEGNSSNVFSISRPISKCEVRAAKYLSEVFSRELRTTALLRSDIECQGQTNLSYVALGGPGSNMKTSEALAHSDNRLVTFNNQGMTLVTTNQVLFSGPTSTHDFGLILKVCPSEHAGRSRVWIVCAGFNEWGTSGAAWYLAQNWHAIAQRFGTKPFALIIQVVHNNDDSAREVYSSMPL
jgi:hypothetical protein